MHIYFRVNILVYFNPKKVEHFSQLFSTDATKCTESPPHLCERCHFWNPKFTKKGGFGQESIKFDNKIPLLGPHYKFCKN